jgi:hypothetical protein
MSYGQQLNFFAAKARLYGPDWRGLVMCRSQDQLRCAAEDAISFMRDGKYLKGLQLVAFPNGARLYFRVAENTERVVAQMSGREYTQIIWLGNPPDDECVSVARSRLRSRTVPKEDWRFETGVCL